MSATPLHHEPYGAIIPERLVDANKGRVAVVTGAGVGRAIAIVLANSGANLGLIDLLVDELEETKAACQLYKDVGADAFQCDVTNLGAVRDTFRSIYEDLRPIDIHLSNVAIQTETLAFDDSLEGFWKAVEVNFKGTMACTYQVLEQKRKRKSCCIINIASRDGTVDMPGVLSYTSSKAAVVRETPGYQVKIRPFFKEVLELCANPVAYVAAGELQCCVDDISIVGRIQGVFVALGKRGWTKMTCTSLV